MVLVLHIEGKDMENGLDEAISHRDLAAKDINLSV